jgi:hypothetical protein
MFTSDLLTWVLIKKVHLASINHIYLRLSLRKISAQVKRSLLLKAEICRRNTFSDSDISEREIHEMNGNGIKKVSW